MSRISQYFRLELESRQLNAGDLTLVFASKKQRLRVRQIAVAELALKRRPLDKWLEAEQRLEKKHYRPANVTKTESAEKVTGLLRRRRRFFFAWQIPKSISTVAVHDIGRDRLVIVQGTDDSLVKQTMESIGWASGGEDSEIDSPQ